jgi:putative Holliday junction resolvase
MKYIGIDFGSKRVGLSLSDEEGKFAFPIEVLKNDTNLVSSILEIIKNESVSMIVIGESLNQENQKNDIEYEIEKFITTLDGEINLPIVREKEFFTSFEAHSREGKEQNNARENKKIKTENLDAKAAAIILQRYLDKNNK